KLFVADPKVSVPLPDLIRPATSDAPPPPTLPFSVTPLAPVTAIVANVPADRAFRLIARLLLNAPPAESTASVAPSKTLTALAELPRLESLAMASTPAFTLTDEPAPPNVLALLNVRV